MSEGSSKQHLEGEYKLFTTIGFALKATDAKFIANMN